MELFTSWFEDYSWIASIFVAVFATLLLALITKLVFNRVAKQLKRTENLIDDAVFDAIRKPVRWAILFFGILLAFELTLRETEGDFGEYLVDIRNVGLVFLLSWFAYRVVGRLQDVYERERDSSERHAVQSIAKLLRASVVITGTLVALQSVGVSIAAVITFGGVGGIAIGFAARDMLANFFGAFMLFMDKPFAVGDWIRSPDQEIEGTVESIGWRITVIRTFDKRPLYIPNATFLNLSVENPQRMTNRRIYETIGVRYDDIALVAKILEDVRNMLKNHTEIDTNQILMVNLNYFNESSVDFFIYTFTKTTDWARFHEIKEDVLLKIAEIIESNGGEIAFPTRTLHIEPSAIEAVSKLESAT